MRKSSAQNSFSVEILVPQYFKTINVLKIGTPAYIHDTNIICLKTV